MPITGYDDEAEKIGLVRPAARHLRAKVILALIAGVCSGALLAYAAKIMLW
jgi:uncharacterized membrane protein (UPF0136 family)